MRKRISLLIVALMLALTMSFGGAAAAFAAPKGNPKAGGSGHFKGGSKPCKSSGHNPKCPPFGG